jgi:putative DNA primase/helicase
VASGGGLHIYHLLTEFWVFADDAERARARRLLDSYQATVRVRAAARGWFFEATSDLARILRVAGTLDHKLGAPRPVELLPWTT